MSTTMPPIDFARLEGWLDEHAPQLGEGAIKLDRLTGGSSSSVFRMTRTGGTPSVLRLTAFPPRADSVKAMAREIRVLDALRGSSVPVPELYGYCLDDSAIGAPFEIISWIDGWLGSATPPAPFDKPGPDRAALGFAMIDAIAELAKVDYQAVGLADFGKPQGFLERQVDRWLAHIESYKVTENHPGRDIPGLHEVADWLRANTPQSQRISIIHSDVGLPNVMFANEPPARVAAIIDWEIATIGDPLLDLGRAIFALPGRKVGTGKSRMFDFSDFPTREDLAECYAERSGLSVEHLDFYVVLSMFKLGAIIEFNYARMVNGRDSSGQAATISDYILDLFLEARAITRAAS